MHAPVTSRQDVPSTRTAASPPYEASTDRPSAYVATVQTAGLNGGRYEGKQQDRVLSGQVDLRTKEEAQAALAASYHKADGATRKHTREGSTASTIMVTPDGFATIAQTGDSPAILVVRNRRTGEVTIQDKTVDQSPDAERARIEAAGDTVEDGRVNGNLAVSRSFGDRAHQSIISDPTITSHDLRGAFRNPDNDVMVIVTSDGVTDHMATSALAPDIRSARSIDEVAGLIVAHAVHSAQGAGLETSDNISVAALHVRPGSAGSFVGVADGHGAKGEDVAGKVATSITRTMESTAAKLRGGNAAGFDHALYWKDLKAEAPSAATAAASSLTQRSASPSQPLKLAPKRTMRV